MNDLKSQHAMKRTARDISWVASVMALMLSIMAGMLMICFIASVDTAAWAQEFISLPADTQRRPAW